MSEREVRLDLEVPAGQIVALLGPNGAGKSTALALASGTLHPSAGTVHLGSRQVAGQGGWVPPHRRGTSLLAQEPLLLPHLDVLANVAFGPQSQGAGRARARQIAMARLAEVGIAHLAHRRSRELSGGQQQRVALARALAPDPELLLLDEPLGALDVEAAAQMRQVLRTSLREAGRTALVVTHDLLDVLALACSVVVLSDGRVVEQGPTLQVLARPRSEFAARFAGVNMLSGVWESRDAITLTGGLVIHGMPDGGETGPGRPVVAGRAAAATFSPRAVAVHRDAPGGSPRNTVEVRVVGIEQQGELVRLRARTTAGLTLAADVTPAAVASLGLTVGQEVTFVIKAAEVNLYAA
ncbi:ABC transporter ATP-binding protein [Pseudactinotalea sp. Z1732]|uniref:ABC transporter ATP-binding protein n=1 Tax=Micrococcales TaxID=85006 RepID=UPI003C79C842